ncbi:histidine phosphatase family protein [Agarivorans sp. QJM3NY_29]|uniref:histidine phosphatase family protein n=1 Tax=unclassified Agarivorans TaxID=2636026 RepID=UPI003D7CB4C5
MSTTSIDLLRHGLPKGADCFRGHSDFALTEEGMAQMFAAMQHAPVAERLVSSPLRRCRDFAEQYAQQHELELQQAKQFMEIDFGDWDGLPKQQVWEREQQVLSAFWADPWHVTPPGGESLLAYEQRIVSAWKALLKQHRGKRVLLVTHGGVIKQILRYVLQLPRTASYLQRLEIGYAARISISVFHDSDGQLWPQVSFT